MHVGSVIRDLREAQGITQDELSREIGIARTYLTRIENGKQSPGMDFIRSASRALDVPVALLFCADDEGGDVAEDLRKILVHVLKAKRLAGGHP